MSNVDPVFERCFAALFLPKRSKPPKRSRGKRKGPWRNLAYRKWVASQPCFLTGKPAQCAHITHNGMASKGADYETVPASPEIHDQIDGRQKLPNGEVGKRAFEAFYKVNLLEIAQAYWQRYQAKKESEAA